MDPVPLPDIADILAAAWQSESAGFLFTFTNQAHHTNDHGDNWSLVTGSMTDNGGRALPALLMDAVIDDGRIVAVDFAGNFLESGDGAVWSVTPGAPGPMIALTKLPDGTLIAVGNAGNIWRSAAAPVAYLPPAITSIVPGSNEEGEILTITATGTPGLTFRLVSSPDLASWTPESSLTPADPAFSFTVGRPAAGSRRFYRLEETGGRQP